MKIVVVYYSLEGNTAYIAKEIQKETGADLCQLEPVKAYPTGKASKFIWGGKSVVFGEKPQLKAYTFDEKAYDTIIFATPVWASCYVPPIKTFLAQHTLKGKQIGIVACSSSGNAEKCFEKLRNRLKDCEVKATLSLIDPAVHKKESDLEKVKAFSKQMMGTK